jgi:hypothetical protein
MALPARRPTGGTPKLPNRAEVLSEVDPGMDVKLFKVILYRHAIATGTRKLAKAGELSFTVMAGESNPSLRRVEDGPSL